MGVWFSHLERNNSWSIHKFVFFSDYFRSTSASGPNLGQTSGASDLEEEDTKDIQECEGDETLPCFSRASRILYNKD